MCIRDRKSMVLSHPEAAKIIGPGIIKMEARFMDSHDPNWKNPNANLPVPNRLDLGHHASLLLRLPSAKECGGPFHKECLQHCMQNSRLGKMQSIHGTGVTHGRDHGNPTTKRLPSIDT